jgi:hypothetical protein
MTRTAQPGRADPDGVPRLLAEAGAVWPATGGCGG